MYLKNVWATRAPSREVETEREGKGERGKEKISCISLWIGESWNIGKAYARRERAGALVRTHLSQPVHSHILSRPFFSICARYTSPSDGGQNLHEPNDSRPCSTIKLPASCRRFTTSPSHILLPQPTSTYNALYHWCLLKGSACAIQYDEITKWNWNIKVNIFYSLLYFILNIYHSHRSCRKLST